jgi:hypothetical protein
MNHQKLEEFRLKCENILSRFKKKHCENFIKFGDTQYDAHIQRILTLTTKVDSNLIDQLYEEYSSIEKSDEELEDELVVSIQKEYDNMEREDWYNDNFENWRGLPTRQECDNYPLPQRLHYSKCRTKMFDHIEKEWKKKTFPTLYERLEFF